MAKKAAKGQGKRIDRIEIALDHSAQEGAALLETLRVRFESNRRRHEGLEWSAIQAKLEVSPEKLVSLLAMERSGGEPDVVEYDAEADEFIFFDCSAQSPAGRRSICYDGEGEAERVAKGVFPAGNAVDLAAAMRIELLNEDQYRTLQTLGEFDTKTESWIQTPPAIRELGGAIFADRRYNHVFVFHNSARSFYASRGFRGLLRV